MERVVSVIRFSKTWVSNNLVFQWLFEGPGGVREVGEVESVPEDSELRPNNQKHIGEEATTNVISM